MHRFLRAALVLAACVPAVAGAQRQRQENAFSWDGTVAAGRWVQVRNINGEVNVVAATGNKVEVTATKSWRRGDPRKVRIVVQRTGTGDGDVLICALWKENSTCDERGIHSSGGRNDRNDTSVEFTVKLPRGVHVDIGTVNGGVEIDGATGKVEASTVNGGITANSTGGPVHASTVNGSIDVRMGSAGTEDLEYETVNGSIRVVVPDGIDANLDMSTVNGRLESEFPITIQGRVNPRHIRATIGKGGRRLKASTVNGGISIRKG